MFGSASRFSNHPVPGSPKKVAIFSLREIGADQTSVLSTRCKYLVGEIERVLTLTLTGCAEEARSRPVQH